MSRENAMLARREAKRLLITNVKIALAAAAHSGDQFDRDAIRFSVITMGHAFMSAGWKPRVRVPAGRRAWAL